MILGASMSMIKVQRILHNTIPTGLLMVYKLQEGRFGTHPVKQGTQVRQKKKKNIYIYIYTYMEKGSSYEYHLGL